MKWHIRNFFIKEFSTVEIKKLAPWLNMKKYFELEISWSEVNKYLIKLNSDLIQSVVMYDWNLSTQEAGILTYI